MGPALIETKSCKRIIYDNICITNLIDKIVIGQVKSQSSSLEFIENTVYELTPEIIEILSERLACFILPNITKGEKVVSKFFNLTLEITENTKIGGRRVFKLLLHDTVKKAIVINNYRDIYKFAFHLRCMLSCCLFVNIQSIDIFNEVALNLKKGVLDKSRQIPKLILAWKNNTKLTYLEKEVQKAISSLKLKRTEIQVREETLILRDNIGLLNSSRFLNVVLNFRGFAL